MVHVLRLDLFIQILFKKKEHLDILINYEKDIDIFNYTGDDTK